MKISTVLWQSIINKLFKEDECECALAERLESESEKYGPKGQDQMAKTLESISEGIANSKWLKRN